MKKKKSTIDPSRKRLLKILDAEQKRYSEIFNSASFKLFTKQSNKIKKNVQKVLSSFEPASTLVKNNQKIMESMVNSFKNLPSAPSNINIKIPISVHQKKVYSESELDSIIEKVIRETIKKTMPPKNRFPYELPQDFPWARITIKFIDGHNIKIVAEDYIYNADFKELNFQNSKNKKPNAQWELLKSLSENNGKISWDISFASSKIKKRKQLLSQGLKKYFQIKSDPFFSYRKEKGYKIKINLAPESTSINDVLPQDELGIEEAYNEQTYT